MYQFLRLYFFDMNLISFTPDTMMFRGKAGRTIRTMGVILLMWKCGVVIGEPVHTGRNWDVTHARFCLSSVGPNSFNKQKTFRTLWLSNSEHWKVGNWIVYRPSTSLAPRALMPHRTAPSAQKDHNHQWFRIQLRTLLINFSRDNIKMNDIVRL